MEPIIESPEELSAREGYAAWATFYDDDGNPLLPLEGAAMRALFGPIAGQRVLDLGCGTGRHTLDLARAGARVTALDQSPEMIAQAQPKLTGYPVDWVLHALPDLLPFPKETFALVVSGLVVEHVPDLPGLLREVARVLVPGGRCLLSALHPDRTAEGQRARFIDPQTGVRRPIATFHRSFADYHAAISTAGLVQITAQTLVVSAELAQSFPRAQRYVGRPLGWVAALAKPG
jgi:SAM-dependent methyltransferase